MLAPVMIHAYFMIQIWHFIYSHIPCSIIATACIMEFPIEGAVRVGYNVTACEAYVTCGDRDGALPVLNALTQVRASAHAQRPLRALR